jgi:hypothetical protein
MRRLVPGVRRRLERARLVQEPPRAGRLVGLQKELQPEALLPQPPKELAVQAPLTTGSLMAAAVMPGLD